VTVHDIDVEAARRGDRAAFARLFETYAPMVHGIGLARLAAAEADDLVQEVFITAMEKIRGLEKDAAVGAWLAKIARRRAEDFARRSARLVPLTTDFGREDPARVEAERVLDVIRALPEAYRETLVLRLVEGMTGPEIAERTGLTPGSVRVNLHRGMQLLKERLGVTS
jgi:RNA polymerase sigma-70 factor, ECF subfamily